MPSDTDSETAQVTTGANWKGAAKEGQIIELPSGNLLRVRRTMDLLHLLKAGRIPSPLKGIVQRMVDRGGGVPEMQDMDGEQISAMLRLVDDTVLRAVTEPRVIPPPEPGKNADGSPLELPEGEDEESSEAYQLRITEWMQQDHGEAVLLPWIELEDRMYIFVFSQGFAADLATFRSEQAASMAALSDGAAVPVPSEQPGGGH